MGYHEQLPHDSPLLRAPAVERKPKPEMLSVGDNRVQLALMDAWNERKELEEQIPHSELARTWIEEGYAEKYRVYAEKAPKKQVDIHDKDNLAETLAELDIEALH